MRKNTIVMVGIAVVFGLLAVFVAQGWLTYQAELSRKTTEPKAKPVATRNMDDFAECGIDLINPWNP